jgi:hypothetical protein
MLFAKFEHAANRFFAPWPAVCVWRRLNGGLLSE